MLVTLRNAGLCALVFLLSGPFAPSLAAAEAFVSITPSGGIEASTYGSGSLQITNSAAAGGARISGITLNLSSSFLPDIVFDPVGAAGDETAKCLIADSGGAATGFVAPADACVDPFSLPHDGGYDEIALQFTDFDPGESFTFSVDIDPTSIQTAGGAGGAGSVSGLELTGSLLTVPFDSAEVYQATLFRTPASVSGAQSIAKSGGPAAPGVELLGVPVSPATVTQAAQTVRVSAAVGADVRLLVIEGALDLGSAPGFDLDPYEANTAVLIQEFGGTVPAGGFVDFPVTLTRSSPEGGFNHILAAVVDGDGSGRTGPVSSVVLVELVVPAAINFTSSGLQGATVDNPTSLDFGPDGRLYVAQQNGLVLAYTIQRTGPGSYQATATETIALVQAIPNHDDLGAPDAVSGRQVTGLLAAGTAVNPVLYVSSSDPRIGAGGGGNDLGLDTNSGLVSRLTWNGSAWDRVHLVRGLPRSEENHATNGMALDAGAQVLYVMAGGHSNKGAPSNNFAQTQEYALSAAMLSVDLAAIDAMPTLTDGAGQSYKYDLPTLDDPTRDADTDGAPGSDSGDPFGGNDGRNQAIIVPGGPVQVYSPGYRNAYDVVLTQAGRLYTFDNGPNSGWGGVPVGEGTATCTNQTQEAGSTGYGDGLHYVSGAGYYGGHPHPTRANPETSGLYVYENQGGNWVLTEQYDWQTDFPTPPVPLGTGNAIECDYRIPVVEDGALAVINASTNGLAEYTATNFGAAMQGDLLAAAFDGNIYRFQLNAAGDALEVPEEALFTGFGGQPLDIVAQSDGDVFPGTAWAAVYGADSVVVFEPVDFTSCSGAYDAGLDEDGDGYSNADELDNGTDPCSGGSKPDDNDGDFLSDLNDPDDDDDGVPDVQDAFAIDADNGTTTSLPVDYPLFNALPGEGFFGLGFTGLMINGTTDYLTQFDETQLAAGGAAGLFTVEQATAGDCWQASNDQDNAFQFGIDVDAADSVFSIQTRLLSPFFQVGGSQSVPVDFQSYGIFVGVGDQDNYFKIVLEAQGGSGGIGIWLEEGGATSGASYDTVVTGDLLGSVYVDLYVTIDPASATIQGHVSTDGGTLIDLGTPVAVPAGWFDGADGRGLAVGVISTAADTGIPFGATWDFFEITAGVAGTECLTGTDCTDGDVCSDDLCNAGLCEHSPAAAGGTCEADGDLCTLDQCDGLGGCVTADNVDCPPDEACEPATGGCVPIPVDADSDGLLNATDPCPLEARNLCFGPVAVDETAATPIRINANVSAAECSGTKTDCNGDTWYADFGYNQADSSFACDLGGGGEGCVIGGITAIFGCEDESTEDIFQCEHWDAAGAPELLYSFDLPDGEYVVNLLFANAYTGTGTVGSRVTDIVVEGLTVYDDFDQVAAAGADGTAVVRAALAQVSDGNGLQIELLHVAENPAIKGIEVLAAPGCTVGIPSSPIALSLEQIGGTTELSWVTDPDAEHHDVVRGDLAVLRGAAGDFAAALDTCLLDDTTSPGGSDADPTPAGEARWYLVRAGNCAGVGSFNSGGNGQQLDRDAGCTAAPAACP